MADAADKPKFDIYGMLLVLTFLVYLGGFLIVNDDLTNNYGFKLFGDKDTSKHASHITELHEPNKDSQFVSLRQEDLNDYLLIKGIGAKDFPIKNYEWPKEFDTSTKGPVRPNVVLTDKQIEDLKAMFPAAVEAPKETPAPETQTTPSTTAGTTPTTTPDTTPSTTAATTPSTTASTTPATTATTTPATTPEAK
jgi:hypothetical protein